MAFSLYRRRRTIALILGTSLIIALICINVAIFPTCNDNVSAWKGSLTNTGNRPARLADPSSLQLHDLVPGVNPSTVHFLWCGIRTFKFENYLSVLSTVQVLRPVTVVFHCSHPPQQQEGGQDSWFEELRTLLPNVVVNLLGAKNACHQSRRKKLNVALDILGPRGGIFVGHNTLVTSSLGLPRDASFAFSLPFIPGSSGDADAEGMVVTLPGGAQNVRAKVESGQPGSAHHHLMRCASVKDFNADPRQYPCVVMSGSLQPRDIWQMDNPFGAAARTVAYGSSDVLPLDVQMGDEEIPRVGHVVMMPGEKFTTENYLSFISALHVAGLQKVHLHSENEPNGDLWRTLVHSEDVSFHRSSTSELMADPGPGETASGMKTETLRSTVGLALLWRGGGVLFHPRVIFLKHLAPALLTREAMLAPDPTSHTDRSDVISVDLVLAKPGASLLRQVLTSTRDVIGGVTNNFQPGKALYCAVERQPQRVTEKSDVFARCSSLTCRLPRTRKSPSSEDGKMRQFDWRTDPTAILFDHPLPLDLVTLRNATGLAADIGRFVLKTAGKG